MLGPSLRLVIGLLACGEPAPDTPLACADGELLDGQVCVPQACGLSPWGDLDADVWVDSGAPEGGDGSQERPFQAVGDALGPDVIIGVAAGTYAEALSLDEDHDDVQVRGRCAALVVLDATDQDDAPGLVSDGRIADTWTVSGVTLTGGLPGVLHYAGHLVLQDVLVDQARLAGILSGSSGGELSLEQVTVQDVVETSLGGASPVGYGVDLENGTFLSAEGLTVSSALGVGILVSGDGTRAVLRDTVVLGTRPGSGGGGYGLEVIRDASATATGLLLQDSVGAGALVTSGGQADLGDLVVQGTTGGGDDVAGLMVHSGGVVSLAGALLADNAGTAVAVLDDGSSVGIDDSTLAGFVDQPTKGLQLQWGAQATLQDVRIEDHGGRGIEVAGGVLQASDTTVQRVAEVALLAGLPGTQVVLERVLIRDTLTRADGSRGAGIELIDQGTLDATDLVIQDAHGAGLLVSSDAVAVVSGLEIRDTHPDRDGLYGRGVVVQDGGQLDLSDGLLVDNREAGLFVSSGSVVSLRDVGIQDTGRSGVYAAGAGLNVQDGGAVDADSLSVTGTEGPGIYVVDGAVDCRDCTVSGNGFAGAVVRSGRLALVDGDVSANPPDDGLGGGVGLLVLGEERGSELAVDGTRIAEHAYGAVYLDGPGSYRLDGADLSGGAGWELAPGRALHGDAVFAAGAVGPWADDQGLSIAGCTLRDSAGAGVFLDGASATLSDNTWSGNAVDLVQQGCGDDTVGVEGVEGAPSTALCPATQRLVVPLEMTMTLQDAAASAF